MCTYVIRLLFTVLFYTRMQIHTHTITRIHTHTPHTHIYIYIYIYIYTYIYIFIIYLLLIYYSFIDIYICVNSILLATIDYVGLHCFKTSHHVRAKGKQGNNQDILCLKWWSCGTFRQFFLVVWFLPCANLPHGLVRGKLIGVCLTRRLSIDHFALQEMRQETRYNGYLRRGLGMVGWPLGPTGAYLGSVCSASFWDDLSMGRNPPRSPDTFSRGSFDSIPTGKYPLIYLQGAKLVSEQEMCIHIAIYASLYRTELLSWLLVHVCKNDIYSISMHVSLELFLGMYHTSWNLRFIF